MGLRGVCGMRREGCEEGEKGCEGCSVLSC